MTKKTPKGQLAIQTIAMPADTNPNGDIFGGWLVSQMDLAGGVVASQTAHGRVVTVAIDSMSFHQPVNVGDIVCCFAEVLDIGCTSLRIKIDVVTQNRLDGKERHVTEGIFTYVAIDENGRPRPVKQTSAPQ